MRSARMLFDKIPERDIVLWTAMIDGYGKMEDIQKARALFDVLSLFRWMQEVGMEPNESVLVSGLTACAHVGALAQGLWIHSYAKRYNLVFNPILATALVDMYSKCGCLGSTLLVYKDIPNKDAGAGNAIISGATMNGDARKLLNLFDKMTIDGTRPTETTFDGLKLFEQMVTFYGVNPKFEHHACVVDLLARVGMLKEAEKFLEKEMSGVERADANVWGALLGASRVYENV
ncbi:hypothetical protein CsSME_00051394 [Camellia sinensis var. sinensis]